MTSQSASVTALKKLARERRLKPGDSTKHLRDLTKRGPRSCAILGAAILDVMLENVILENFRPLSGADYDSLFGNSMPLGSFSAKISTAYAMRLIDQETKRNLNYIREIRNALAHTVQPLGFRTKEVAAVARLLTPTTRLSAEGKKSAQFLFVVTCINIGQAIAERGYLRHPSAREP